MKHTPHTQLEEQLTHAGKQSALSVSEKNTGRAELQAYVSAHPLPVSASPRFSFTYGLRIAGVCMLVLAIGGGGIASAAEGSLPGNVLYPIKVEVSEPLRSAFLFTDEARADFKTERANRRLAEVAELVTRHEDVALLEQPIASLREHISDVQDTIKTLDESGENTEAIQISSELESVLSAQVTILEQADNQYPHLQALTAELMEEERETTALLADLNQEIASSNETHDESIEEQTDSITKLLGALNAEALDDASQLHTENIDSTLASVERSFAEAREKQEGGVTQEAFLQLVEAEGDLRELTVLLEAQRDWVFGSTTPSE